LFPIELSRVQNTP